MLQKFGEAIEYYTKALDMEYFDNGFVFELLCSRASARSKIGNFRGVIDDCSRALILYPCDVNMRLLRANCYCHDLDIENAIKDFEVALTAQEVQMNSKQTEKIELKISVLKKRLAAEKPKINGDKLVQSKKYEAALICFSEAIASWPENISFYTDRANCFINLNDYKGAIKDYQSILTIDGSRSKVYYDIIKCFLICGEVFAAKTIIDKFNSSISKNDDIINGYKKRCDEMGKNKFSANDYYNKKSYRLACKRNS